MCVAFCGLVPFREWKSRVSKAMHVLSFTIAFAFETKLTGGNNQHGEIIVVISDPRGEDRAALSTGH